MSLKHFLSALRTQNGICLGVNSRVRMTLCIANNSQEIDASPKRGYASYYKSRTEESPDKYTKFEKSFDEWKYVEKLIPPKYVPQPPADPNVEYPSGWKPANPPKDCQYYIRRTKNHAVPVYEQIMDRGQVRFTYIRRVEGDIWQLERDIGHHLARLYPTEAISTKVYEINRLVIISGNYVEDVKKWLLERGF